MIRELLKALCAALMIGFIGTALWLDGMIVGMEKEQTAVVVVQESGHKRVVCE